MSRRRERKDGGENRTYIADITNRSAVASDLDVAGKSGSKLWNIGVWTTRRIWSEVGEIPEEDVLKAYLKKHPRWKDLPAYSSQRILEELADAYGAWYELRRNGNTNHNPPGYRKHYHQDNTTTHPRSTITWKANSFKIDTKNQRVRLSKGANMKSSPRAREYTLVKYETRPDITLENVSQVRAVYKHDRWELHFVCEHTYNSSSPGNETAGIDLGICNLAAVACSTKEASLYPGNTLKEDEYYFLKELAKCNESDSRKAERLNDTLSGRRSHMLHATAKDIVEFLVEQGVGQLAIGHPKHIRQDEDGNPRNWGSHGNLDLNRWPFRRLATLITYKAVDAGITVYWVDERNTSKTCSVCGHEEKNQRVERGLYSCRCGVEANSDVGGAENIRQTLVATDGGTDVQVTQSSLTEFDTGSNDEVNMSTGWLAQPVVNRFRRGEHGLSSEAGTFEQVSSPHES